MKNKLLFPLALLLVSVTLIGQTLEERQKIVASYNFDLIRNYKVDLKASFESNRAFTESYLRTNPLPLTYTTPSGGFAELQYVERDGTPIYYTTNNTGAGITIRANRLHTGGTLGLNVNGQGMYAGVWDGGAVRTTHNDFGGVNSRAFQRDTPASNSDHSTHVAGTIAGNGTNALFHRGVAYQSFVWAHDWNSDLFEVIDRCEEGLLVSNHSYGFGIFDANGNMQLPMYYFGAYIQNSRNWDIIMNMYPNYLYVTAAGNDRASNSLINDKNGYDLLSGTKLAKNGLTVGAVENVSSYTGPNSVLMSSFSNWGPSDDGRIKPDLVAKGVSVLSPVATSNTARSTLSGTSMAAPGVTGGILLLQQHHHNVFGKYMLASTVKGLTLHTCDEAGGTAGPDYQYGWGLMNTEAAAQAISNNGLTSIVRELTLNPGQTITVTVKALGGSIPLMASVSWTDLPGVINAGVVDDPTPVLVNDLDIRVTQGASTFFPWKLNPASPFLAATNGDNIVDPFEKIQINNATGDYVITISHKGTLAEPQNFALVVTGVDSKFTFRTSEPLKTACTNQSAVFNFNYITNSTDPTTFSVANLPAGATGSFSVNPISAAGTFSLTVGNLTGVAPGLYDLEVTGLNGTEEEKVTVQLRVYSATFSSLNLTTPTNQAGDQPLFSNLSWEADVNASSYEVQVSTNSSFSSIVESATVSTNFYITNNLSLNTIYFWRVRQVNQCGTASYSPVRTFSTVNLICGTATNTTVASIASVANTVVISNLTFNNPSVDSIYDIDVAINITHTWVQDMTLKLTSPQGTVVILQQEACGSQDDINAIYDDNGAPIVCSATPPAISGRVLPFEALTGFANQNPNGVWTLEVNDPWNGDGGSLNTWSITACKQIASLSAESFEFKNLTIYPNPTNGLLNITFDAENNDKVTFELFDVQGRKISSASNDQVFGAIQQTLDISQLPTGMYMLKITQGDKNYSSKVVKQ